LDSTTPAAKGRLDPERANLDAKAPGFFCARGPAASRHSNAGASVVASGRFDAAVAAFPPRAAKTDELFGEAH
jgi:hypothetical protein